VNYFNVGKIVNTHGIRGEVKVLPISDFADMRLRSGETVVAFSPDGKSQLSFEIVRSREHKQMFLVTFRGIDSLNDAEKIKGWQVKIAEHQLHDLDEGEYYYHEIIGCEVTSDTGESLGVITDILTPGANHVWVVRTAQKRELLLPVIDDVVLRVDVKEKRVLVHLLEGLM
jgi:16S rRNA processing protein RimM